MSEASDHPKVIRRVCGIQQLRIDTSIAQDSSPAITSSTPEFVSPSPESSHASPNFSLRDFRHIGLSLPPKNLLQRSQDHSTGCRSPTIMQNRPHTGQLGVMKRKIIWKMPSPIRGALMTLRGRKSSKIRQTISEPFDAVKIVDGKPENLHRNTQAPAASELETASPAPVLCLRKISPPRLALIIPELTITTVDGKTGDPSAQSHLQIRPQTLGQESQATLNEARAWKTHAEIEHRANIRLSQTVQRLEEQIQAIQASAKIQKASADHFRMLFEKESTQVERLEENLECAIERAVAAESKASRSKSFNRSSSQRTTGLRESWSPSDEAKFHASKIPISSPLSPTASVSSTVPDDRKGWVTAAQIMDGSGSDDQSDPEDIKPPPARPTFAFLTPSTDSVKRISFNHNINTHIRNPPDVFRIPISPVRNTAIQETFCDWCPSLDMWEWCSVPELKLRDFVAEEKRKKRTSGRVFQGRGMVTLKLGAMSI
ncbi:hypothetical protein DID88_005243 [Monilinia fructigena]|uniref:Uncharacterized protein n=1 Tax=Monilinia fructigena TaxID=38457 RepID=A0A395IZI8_9HELO|nr:hypothetical protein DID88_005243 [Monilinia fructigena]